MESELSTRQFTEPVDGTSRKRSSGFSNGPSQDSEPQHYPTALPPPPPRLPQRHHQQQQQQSFRRQANPRHMQSPGMVPPFSRGLHYPRGPPGAAMHPMNRPPPFGHMGLAGLQNGPPVAYPLLPGRQPSRGPNLHPANFPMPQLPHAMPMTGQARPVQFPPPGQHPVLHPALYSTAPRGLSPQAVPLASLPGAPVLPTPTATIAMPAQLSQSAEAQASLAPSALSPNLFSPSRSAGKEGIPPPNAATPEKAKPGAGEQGPLKVISDEEEAFNRAWAAHKSEDGQVYYFNSMTNESSWTKPEGFSGEVWDAKPTSQLRVPGTSWYEIHCEDGRKYYYNDKSEETSWTVPVEVAELKQQVKAAKSNAPLSAVAAVNNARANIPYNPPKGLDDVTYSDDDIKPRIPQPQVKVEQPPLPIEIPPPQPPPEHLRKKPRAELTADFYDLLAEKGVTAFSRWEKELPKLLADQRFKAIANMKDRKAAFEEYCKSSTEQKRKVKQGAGRDTSSGPSSSKEAQACFKSLLLEATMQLREGPEASATEPILHSETMYRELEEKYKEDPRWQACSEKVREELFDEQIEDLKTRKIAQDQKIMEALESDYRLLLSSSNINGSSRWSKSKDSLAKDPRYKALARDLREKLFRDFVAQQKKEEEAREKARREREKKEQSIKERQQKEADEAEKRRKKAAHADALANYMTLLNETVKDPEARWSEWKAKLQQDPQKRATNPALDSKEAESCFKDHINELHKRAFTAFSDRMDLILRPLLPKDKAEDLPGALTSFHKAEKLWQDDHRTTRLTSREREKVWKRYVDELILERDDPAKLAGRSRLAAKSKANEKERASLRDGNEERDQAYDREYLAHDRKRLRRD